MSTTSKRHMPVSRATFSIESEVLSRFNRLVPPGVRSKYVETLLEKELEKRDRELDAIADDFMTHPDLKEVREDSALWAEVGLKDGLDD